MAKSYLVLMHMALKLCSCAWETTLSLNICLHAGSCLVAYGAAKPVPSPKSLGRGMGGKRAGRAVW